MKIKLPFTPRLLAIGFLILATVFVFQIYGSISLVKDQPIENVASAVSPLGIASPEKRSSLSATDLLTEAASRLQNSTALRSAARLKVNLFEQDLVAIGHYAQMGQGTGFAKLELEYEDEYRPFKVVQICNRGVYYRFQSMRDDSRLQIADLRRLAETDSNGLFTNRNAWMTTGGLSSLLEILIQNFDFEPITETLIGSTPVFKIRGEWNEDRLKRYLFGQVKHTAIKDRVEWQDLPVQVPQFCEIMLGNDDYLPLFPYRITFLKRPFDVDEPDAKLVNMVTLDLYEVEKNAAIQVSEFDVNFGGAPPDDLTKSLADRIEVLNQIQRSAKQQKSQSQTR